MRDYGRVRLLTGGCQRCGRGNIDVESCLWCRAEDSERARLQREAEAAADKARAADVQPELPFGPRDEQ